MCISMHKFIAGHSPYNLFVLTIDYSKILTTRQLPTIGHMTMFVVISIRIQIHGQVEIYK